MRGRNHNRQAVTSTISDAAWPAPACRILATFNVAFNVQNLTRAFGGRVTSYTDDQNIRIMQDKIPVVIIGAAGMDYHVFNRVYRDNPMYDVQAFTMALEQNLGTCMSSESTVDSI